MTDADTADSSTDSSNDSKNPLAGGPAAPAAAAATDAASETETETPSDVADAEAEAASEAVDRDAESASAEADVETDPAGAGETQVPDDAGDSDSSNTETGTDVDGTTGEDSDTATSDNSDAPTDDDSASNEEDEHPAFFADPDTVSPEFKLTTEVGPLMALLEKAKPLINEVRVQLTEETIGFVMADPANVALIDARLSTAAFESFELSSSGIVGIKLQSDSGLGLYDALSQFDAGTAVTIELDRSSMDIIIKGDGLDMTIGPIDPDSIRKSPKIPPVEDMTEAHAELDYSDLKDAVSAGDLVSDHLTVESDGNSLSFRAKGDTDSIEQSFDATDLFAADLEDVEAIYALEYLKEIARGLSSGSVTVNFGDGMPMVFLSEFAEDEDSDMTHGETEFMLAPRIQEE
jgi:hypothetical protein